jgi:PTS system mannose-specific IIA component
MTTGVVVVAHAPLAAALATCVRHVLDEQTSLLAYDVPPYEDPAVSEAVVRERILSANEGQGVVVLTDLFGATPANVATRAAATLTDEGLPVIVLAGVNASMMLRALAYRQLPLEEVAQRTLAGGRQAVLRVDGLV